MSCKDVCVSSGFDGTTEFYVEKNPRAAKPYTCCECGRAIAKSEVHHLVSGKTDGDFWSVRTCLQCDEIRKAFCCDGFVIGSLWADIADQLFPRWNEMTTIDCLAKLTTDDAVAKMRAEYAAYQERRR